MTIRLPGFFDLQVNGFGGIDFNAPDLTANQVGQAIERMRDTGVTRFLPTLITSSLERFSRSARILSDVADPTIAGIHMVLAARTLLRTSSPPHSTTSTVVRTRREGGLFL
jgi:N-acetylglucosamine-6-phosphate deacetylase